MSMLGSIKNRVNELTEGQEILTIYWVPSLGYFLMALEDLKSTDHRTYHMKYTQDGHYNTVTEDSKRITILCSRYMVSCINGKYAAQHLCKSNIQVFTITKL